MGNIGLLYQGFCETFTMVGVSFIIGLIGGCPLGALVYYFSDRGIKSKVYFYYGLGFIINMMRSIPYIILIILLIPLTRYLVGSSIGTVASIIPLSFASILLVARATEESLRNVPKNLIEMGLSLGSSVRQIFFKIIIPEALSSLLNQFTNILITLVGFSAMAGTVGGGGLGDLAIRYGYQRYDFSLMIIIVCLLLFLVQCIQIVGDLCVRYYRYH